MFLKGIGEYYYIVYLLCLTPYSLQYYRCFIRGKILFYSRFKIGYYQIPVAKEDRPKTAFSFPGGGLWQFKRMSMGLSNSAPVFERLIVLRILLLSLKSDTSLG
jgi:hypothetical protein